MVRQGLFTLWGASSSTGRHGFYGLGATMGPLVVAAMPSSSCYWCECGRGAGRAGRGNIGRWPSMATSAANRRLSDPHTPSPWGAVAVSVLALGATIGIAGFWGGSTMGRLTMAHRGVVRLTDRVGLAGFAAIASMLLLGVPASVGALVDSRGPEVIPIVAVFVLVCVGLPLLVLVNRLPDRLVRTTRSIHSDTNTCDADR